MGPDGGSGYAEQAAVDATTIDAEAIGREAAEKARATANAVAIDAGDYPVVLEEYAVVDLLDMLGYLGFSALAVQEERSFVEIGRTIGSDLVVDRRRRPRPGGLPMAFDYEGVRQAARHAPRRAASAAVSSTTPRRPRATAWPRPGTACPPRTHGGRSRSTW